MQENKFNIGYVIDCFQAINQCILDNGEVPFDRLCQALDEFCVVLKELNSFLGIAFSDVKDKVATIKKNNQMFEGHGGFYSFIRMEIQENIHIYNGKNNAKLKAKPELKEYSSTARNLLRMMWLLTFLRVTFTQCEKDPNQTLSTIFNKAYDEAFGSNHSWLMRKSAKVAILTSSDRKKLIQVMIGLHDEKAFSEYNTKLLQVLIPVHESLWKFYTQKQLTKLQ